MIPLSRRSWQFSIAILLVTLVTAGLMLSDPAAAQEPDQPHDDFSPLSGPFETPQEVTSACLECHFNADEEMLASIHWTWEYTDPITGQQLGKNNVINNYCMAVPSNEPRCTSCHAGYGYDDKSFFETATAEDIDCLICHDSTGTYKKFPTAAGYPVLDEPREFPPGSGKIWEPVDLVMVAQNVERPGRANCGSCHFFGGGGDAVKHGDLDSTLANPDAELDVHMGTDGLDFSCTTCHNGDDHDIKGRVYNGEERVLCEDCHTGDYAPHQGSEMETALSSHTESVACQTCHIPAFARGQPTKMSWDWSTAGDLNDEGRPYQLTNEAGQVVYDSKKGTFTWEMDVVPEYRWWNGNTFYLTVESQIDPSGIVTINEFTGERGDGKIYPFKRFTGMQPYDAGNNTLVIPNLFPNDATDTDAYWRSWDWQAAVDSGMAYAEADFSGDLGWVDTEMFWVQNHMVAPVDQALTCSDCHTAEGRLDFQALGYAPQRADFLAGLATPGALDEPPHANLTKYEGPETCLICHEDAGMEVAESTHYTWLSTPGESESYDGAWSGLLGMGAEYSALPAATADINWLAWAQPQDESMSQVAVGCARCHVGFGARPNPPDAQGAADAKNIDCLMCHGPNYKRTVTEVDGELRFAPAEDVDVLQVVQSVQSPTNDMCLRCHLGTGGGPNFQHDVGPTSPDVDVHIASGLQCVDCHAVEDHQFGGSGMADATADCLDCHDGQHPVGFTAIDRHEERVACQTCHIPSIARDPDLPTLISNDWMQPELQENGLYAPAAETASNVAPEYRWWNGQVENYPPAPIGSMEDENAKLYPWKYVESIVPMDAQRDTVAPIKASVYYATGDLDQAVARGAELAQTDYSGEWEPGTEQLLFALNHQVAPAAEALRCPDCHTRDEGRLDFVALGFSEVRAADLTRATSMDVDGEPFEDAPQTQEERLEARRYATELEEIQQRRRQTQNLVLGVTLGIVAGLIVAAVLVVLVLRSRGVTWKQARAWISDHRHGVTAVLVVVAVSGLMGFLSIHYLFEFTASEEFCGELCHATRPESVTYHTSLHAEVPCVDCHVGEGLEKELLAKLNGIRELYLQVTNTYERPIPSPVETLRPARQVCETCHWPEVFYADRAIEIPHFANDEDNTRTNTYMLVKIGGGTERRGQGQGIHWHVENKVEYIATDPQRQNIPWVRAELGGETLTFVDVTSPLSEEELAEYEIREMDCIDCHNRASHVFRSPDEMLDEAMANGILPTDLPYLRREAYNAMRDQENFDEAMAAIEAIPAFYQENYPSVFEENQEILADVVEELKDMYATSHFPEARVDHTTYPDNLAHLEDPGCFRCHNGKHYVQDDGDQSIRLHCTICHTIPETVAADEPAPEIPFESEPQPDSHLASTWIADHRYTFDETCEDCHVEETFCANRNCHGRDWPYVNLSVSTPPFPLGNDE
jgi:octaheme c-type cytochrome (tetrathionate reductase family)